MPRGRRLVNTSYDMTVRRSDGGQQETAATPSVDFESFSDLPAAAALISEEARRLYAAQATPRRQMSWVGSYPPGTCGPEAPLPSDESSRPVSYRAAFSWNRVVGRST